MILHCQMEFARYEHETERLRNELRMREANRDQAKSNWEQKEKHMQAMMQQESERRAEEEKRMMSRMAEQEWIH